MSSVSNGLYFLTLPLVSVTRVIYRKNTSCALSIHQKECRKSLGCPLYIRCALSIEKYGSLDLMSTVSLISLLDGGWWLTSRPGRFTPDMTQYPLYRRLGEPQSRCKPKRKILPLTGIRFPDRPAHSDWLYQLSYPGPHAPHRLTLNIS